MAEVIQVAVFLLDEQDQERAKELTFNGVIDGKIATGRYVEIHIGKEDKDDFTDMVDDWDIGVGLTVGDWDLGT